MRKIFAYFLTALAITACTSEESFIEEEVQELPLDGVCVSFENPLPVNLPGSRSSLHYDKFESSKAQFTWGPEDIVAFPHGEDTNHLNSIPFKQQDNQTNSLYRLFEIASENFVSLQGGKQYVAFSPYVAPWKDKFNGYTVTVTYRNQKQTGHVDMRHYFDNAATMTGNTGNYSAYKNSEKEASAHLGAYDYLCAEPTTAYDKGGIKFSMKRMGSIVRFYIKYPAANMVYTDLQLYNETKKFILDANINVDAHTLDAVESDTATNHVVTLKFQEGEEGTDGFDIGVGSSENSFYELYQGKYNAYLIAYMMLAPIDLSEAQTEKSVLYLVAHEPKPNEANKHYYKAVLDLKPNLTPNIFYQWNAASGQLSDQPIEFVETTIQDWKQANGIDNGNGNGTSGW